MNSRGTGAAPWKKLMGLVAVAWIFAASAPAAEVNPFIGTGGRGFGIGSTYPGPCLPFGMARPGPDTALPGVNPGFYHCSGYYYGDNLIRGFSQLRLSGIGVVEYGNVLLMPTLKSGRSFMQEIFYQKVSEHYLEMLKLINLVKW